MPPSNAETADQLTRDRTRMLPLLAFNLLLLQAAFFMGSGEGSGLSDMLRNGAWVFLAAAILALLVTGGFWFRPGEVRRLMNDEVTQANRASGLQLGFTVAVAAAIGMFALEALAPGSVTTRQAIHVVVSLGLVAALLRFAVLERRTLG